MGLLKNIEWTDDSKNTIVYKVDMRNDYVSKGSVLTVRDSQACIFAHKGKMADVFLPGYYKLDTDSIPILTTLMSWKYGFQNPFRSDIYFVNTKQFTGFKWGTANPIIIRDKDYGAVRVRGYGSYSFRVTDPFVFMQELSGTNSSFTTQDITEYLKSVVVSGISDAIGECKIPVLDMAGNLIELGDMVLKSMQPTFNSLGLELTKFVFENFSMPKELEEALDKNATLGIMRGNLDAYTQMAQADALKEAAKNPEWRVRQWARAWGSEWVRLFRICIRQITPTSPPKKKPLAPNAARRSRQRRNSAPNAARQWVLPALSAAHP